MLCDTWVPRAASGPLTLWTAAILVNSRLSGVPHSWAHNVGDVGPQHELSSDKDENLCVLGIACVSSDNDIRVTCSHSNAPVGTLRSFINERDETKIDPARSSVKGPLRSPMWHFTQIRDKTLTIKWISLLRGCHLMIKAPAFYSAVKTSGDVSKFLILMSKRE